MTTEQVLHTTSGWPLDRLRSPTKREGLLALALVLLGLPIAVALATSVVSIFGAGLVGILGGAVTVLATLGVTWLAFAIGFRFGTV